MVLLFQPISGELSSNSLDRTNCNEGRPVPVDWNIEDIVNDICRRQPVSRACGSSVRLSRRLSDRWPLSWSAAQPAQIEVTPATKCKRPAPSRKATWNCTPRWSGRTSCRRSSRFSALANDLSNRDHTVDPIPIFGCDIDANCRKNQEALETEPTCRRVQ